MNKKEALKKLSDLEKETAELRKIIEKPEKKAKRERSKCKAYYFINNIGNIDSNIESMDQYDDYIYNGFNYFATPEEAEEALELKKIENKLLLLIEKINQEDECPDNFPDWENKHQQKYCIIFNNNLKRIMSDFFVVIKDRTNYFYCYRYFLDDAIKEIGEENLEKYFKS